MKKETRIWGYWGAVALVALVILLMIIADSRPHGIGSTSAIFSFIDAVSLPVKALWDVVFKMLGYQKYQQPVYMFAIPVMASLALYFAIIGFCIGALARKFYEL